MRRWYTPMLLGIVLAAVCAGAAERGAVLNVGFSPYQFTDVKKSDAAASIKVWADTLLEGKHLAVGGPPVFYDSTEQMEQALLNGTVDMVSLSTAEFLQIESQVGLDTIHFVVINGRIYDEYLLLVRSDSGVEDLADLKGASLALPVGGRMELGGLWLETLLMEQGFPGNDGFFGETKPLSKTSLAVMSVFFGKTGACIVKRTGFETMAELNPQIGKRLKVLRSSPHFIPLLVCLRASYNPALKQQMATSFRDLHKEARGKQILTTFKCERMVPGTLEDLATTREWIEKHARLQAAAAAGGGE